MWKPASAHSHFYLHIPEGRTEQCSKCCGLYCCLGEVLSSFTCPRSLSLVNQMSCFVVGLLSAETSTNKSFSTALQTVFQSREGGSCVMIYGTYLVFLIGNLHDNLWLHDYVKIIL